MDIDPELNALSTCLAVLAPLDPAARQRSLEWLSRKLDLSPVVARQPAAPAALKTGVVDVGVDDAPDETVTGRATPQLPPDVSTAFVEADPKTNPDKVLVVAWFLSRVQGVSELTGFALNKELKHLGHGLTHITDAIDQLASQKPALMFQTRKSGTSRQARKTYKLTEEGAKAVLSMRDKAKQPGA